MSLKYQEIIRLLDVPKVIIPYLNIIYTSNDMKIIVAIKDKVLSKDEIEIILGKHVEDILKDAYKTAVLDKVVEEDTIKYKVNAISNRLDKLATFQRDKWESIQLKDRKKISAWLYNDFLQSKKNSSLEEILDNSSKILPLDDTIEYLKKIQNDIYVIPCDCKSITENCNYDRNVCLSMGSGFNTSADRGYGEKIDTEKAIQLLRHADKEGLIHSIEKNAICNCCSCCCYPLRVSKELGLKGKWPSVSYIVEIEIEKCISCGICTKRCKQDVFIKDKKVIKMDVSRCLGCGICVNSCPQKALILVSIDLENTRI